MTVRDLVGLVYNPRLPEAARFVDGIIESLGLKKRSWVSAATDLGGMGDKLEGTSLIVVAGGDGTILRTVRVIAPLSIPIVGVNMGRVGFMSELRVGEAVEKLPMYLDGGLRIEERMMLEAYVESGPDRTRRLEHHALNDVVVGRGAASRLVDIATTVDGRPLTTYRADAVIVCTATGSTGYALSAGGPITYPEGRVMLVQPLAAHTGLRDGLVLPEEAVVELKAARGRRVTLSVDGSLDTALEADDKVTIVRSPYVARFLRADPASDFYADLTRRLIRNGGVERAGDGTR